MDCGMPGFPVHHRLLELAQTHVHRVGDAIQPSYPLSSPSLPAFNLFQHQGLFQWVSPSTRWPKYWRFSISPSNEYSGLISIRIDWFDLHAVQGTLPQFKSINSLVLGLLYGPTLTSIHACWQNHTLTRRTFAGKVISLLFNMLSRLVIALQYEKTKR